MNQKYFKTKSKTFALAIQYVTNQNYYKFQDDNNITYYSFAQSDELINKIKMLNNIKFN